MKTSELTGAALDWAVATCEDLNTGFPGYWSNSVIQAAEDGTDNPFAYSTNWAQGGPIIEREKIRLDVDVETDCWFADFADSIAAWAGTGPTPLIAAMRCYVASKLGKEVEVPDELH